MAPPDPTKYGAIRKETVYMEHEARRNYKKRWQPLSVTDNYKFYSPDAVNAEIQVQMAHEKTEKPAGALKAEKCRCGRDQVGTHILYCLQREKSRLIQTKNLDVDAAKSAHCNIPKTSNAFIGWKTERPDYQRWEQSMKYLSPVVTMPGPRITATPYNVIFIG